MKILVVDYTYNGFDMAEYLAAISVADVDVFYYPSTPIAHLHNRLVCNLVDRANVPAVALNDFIKLEKFDWVINLSPIHAFMDIENAAKISGAQFLGTTESFAHSEVDKLSFKRFLQDQQLPTPELRFLGNNFVELSAFVERQTQYPLVIKICMHLGTKTRVCQNKEDAAEFIRISNRTPTRH